MIFKCLSDFIIFSVKKPVSTNVLVSGGPGSGKTIMIVEGAKVKISKLVVEQPWMKIKVIVSSNHSSDEPLLLQKLTKDFLGLNLNSVGIEVVSLDLPIFCAENKISTKNPIEKINSVTAKLSEDNPDKKLIFIVDEMQPAEEISCIIDWSKVEVRYNVIWLIALQPMGWWWKNYPKLPDDSDYVLSRLLLYRYRMSPAIK